jgi:integrase
VAASKRCTGRKVYALAPSPALGTKIAVPGVELVDDRALSLPAAQSRAMLVEHEYDRGGALQYLAAWDVGRAKVFGRCEATTGIEPSDRPVDQVMSTEPYASAHCVGGIVDNGSSHRGQVSIKRLEGRYKDQGGHRRVRLIHCPVHASWLNQIEIFFSIVQRKVLTPNDWLPSIAGLEATTRAQREQDLRLRLLPRFGSKPIASISDFDIRELKADLLASGLAPSTVTKSMSTLSQILRAAVINGYIGRNPCDAVKKPGERPVNNPIFLTPSELNALADAIDPRFRSMVLLAGYRGFRFGEIAGLRPARLNLLHGRFDVVEALKEVKGQLYFGPPKHGRRRTVFLPPFLVADLAEHLRSFPPLGDLIFTNPDGSMLRRSNFGRRVWAPAVRRAEVDEGLTFHGLRHSAVSISIAGGASIVELAAVMGWAQSTAAAMAVRYGHLFQEREKQVTDAVESAFRLAQVKRSGGD